MIVQSMRLKNIKSYAEGSDGDGVIISFEPGTNRIAGKNGHGKTTLIESLGYALFLTGPMYEESFQLETYFLRAGKKEAEIDVTFGHRGEFYRIERGLGPHSKRQTKVVQVADGSTCAEGEREVSVFLCRLFNLPDPKRFSELFWKLIGVRQGRLTWPFDAKPSAAKDFFEPLLDVAIFRECFQSLKPAVDEFLARLHEQETVRAGVEERIRERADSVATLEVKRLQFREIELRLQALKKAQGNISKNLARLEATEVSLRAAESQRNMAQHALALARQQREVSDQRMRESTEAAAVVALLVSGYQSFGKSQNELQHLREKQAEEHRLAMEIADAEKRKIALDGRSNAAHSQTDIFARQKQGKETERASLRERVEALRIRLSASQPEFEKQKSCANRAARSLSDVRHFVSNFADLLTHGETTLKRMKETTAALAVRDASALQTARHREETAREKLQSLRQQIAVSNAEHDALRKQLQEIRGGICPFLKEQCQQFDPSKVEGGLKEKRAAIELLQEKRRIAESALRAAQTEHERRRKEEEDLAGKRSRLEHLFVEFSSAFERIDWGKTREAVNELRGWIQQVPPMPECPVPRAKAVEADAFESSHQQNVDYLNELQTWWRGTENLVQARINAVLEEEGRRKSDQRDEFNTTDYLRRIEFEIGKLAMAEDEQREAAAACQRESGELEKIIARLEQRRHAFGFLGEEIALLEQTQQRYRSDYQQYLGAKPLADERGTRERELNARREREGCAEAELRLCDGKLSELSEGFDEAALTVVRREFEGMCAVVATELANLENVRREIDREQSRFREWQAACARRDEIDRVVARLRAAIKLTELARIVLRDSAPMVAQQLCDRIAAQAQRIFNRINHEPVELRWEAAPRYSLRVIPGDRRFAMLSGGEQSKLALAMTLAMIQEFSGLRFCVFDEPTYGVDAESREKLGDAMLESQKAAELEQLILVSHDEAFDGKIEHSIFLRKTAIDGTEVVQFPSQVKNRESQNSVACGA
jgi:DNA repair protein SbcC/Rad50